MASDDGSIIIIKSGLVSQKLTFGANKINCLLAIKSGFGVGGTGGTVNIYDYQNDSFEITRQISVGDEETSVHVMTNNFVDGKIMVGTNTSQMFMIDLINEPKPVMFS